MATEFYKSIPESIKGKLEEYNNSYSKTNLEFEERSSIADLFTWDDTPEKGEFWNKHHTNKTFPQWSDELNRFIDPPQVNTITVNADEYQAMRDWAVNELKYEMEKDFYSYYDLKEKAKQMGIDINEIIK